MYVKVKKQYIIYDIYCYNNVCEGKKQYSVLTGTKILFCLSLTCWIYSYTFKLLRLSLIDCHGNHHLHRKSSLRNSKRMMGSDGRN